MENRCPHRNLKSKANPFIFYCILCSSFAIYKDTDFIETVKPPIYNIKSENEISLKNDFFDATVQTSKIPTDTKNRQKIIKEIKNYMKIYDFSLSTFFHSVEYYDRIMKKIRMIKFDQQKTISFFCLLLAIKLFENGVHGVDIIRRMKEDNPVLSRRFLDDELFILKLLDYDLLNDTAYDYLNKLKFSGFVYENEKINKKRLNYVYTQMDNMILAFIESKKYNQMTDKQIAFGIVGFIRSSLGLVSFNEELKESYNFNDRGDVFYLQGLELVQSSMKIKQKKGKGMMISQ